MKELKQEVAKDKEVPKKEEVFSANIAISNLYEGVVAKPRKSHAFDRLPRDLLRHPIFALNSNPWLQ